MATKMLQLMEGGRIPVEIGTVKEVELLTLLGSGSFGSVWKVRDCSKSGQFYALKVIKGLIPGSVEVERVRLEAGVSIPSKYIIPPVGLCEWDPSTFLILFDYFPGESLENLLMEGSLKSKAKGEIFKQVLLGVGDAHRSNVIHRDLKPANILVSKDGQVGLIDFGISKFKGTGLTVSGVIMGTLPYMAPEILMGGAASADARVDIYSLGQILYEICMGQNLWGHKGWRELNDLLSFLSQEPKPQEIMDLTDFSCDFYPAEQVSRLLLRMVKLSPFERPESIEEVLRDLGYGKDVTPVPPLPADAHLRSPMLIVESGSNKGTKTVINISDGSKVKLGRADIAGGDVSISREHFELTRDHDRYFVRDCSKNGTILRGTALSPSAHPTEIHHTDRIKVGDVFLRFVLMHKA